MPGTVDRPVLIGLTGLAQGGLEMHVLTLARALKRRGDCPFEIVCHFDAWFYRVACEEQLPVTIIPLGRRFSSEPRRQLVEFARAKRCRLLHVHDRRIALAARPVAKKLDLPLLRTYHGWVFNNSLWEHAANYLDLALRIRGEHAVAVSSEIARRLRKAGMAEHEIHRIANSVDFGRFANTPERTKVRQEEGFASDDFVIGMVGRLAPEKNPMLLLEAFEQFQQECSKARLMFIGDGPLLSDLHARAEAAGISKKVKFAGFRSDAIVAASVLDVFVNPSLTEGTPQALIEAMWLGIPVVATRVGGVPDLVEDRREGFLIPSGDSAVLAKAFGECFKNPEICREAARKARERAMCEFSADAMAEKTAEVYAKMMNHE